MPERRQLITRGALALLASSLLVACGGVQVAPTPTLPRALVQKLPLKVGAVVAADMLDFKHQETRGGVTWQVQLGGGHRKFVADVMAATFESSQVYRSLEEAKAAPEIVVIFEPRIEQFSFATARDTGGNYYAATIQYRIHVFNPTGERIDSFSLTGYGNALAGNALSGSDKPLAAAAQSAMRDAAAKFLVQFPAQKLAKQLVSGEPLLALGAGQAVVDALTAIEAVPIRD